jgi:hypothetical protein
MINTTREVRLQSRLMVLAVVVVALLSVRRSGGAKPPWVKGADANRTPATGSPAFSVPAASALIC